MNTDYIFKGTVNSSLLEGLDENFVVLCLDYFDGMRSAMKRFALGRDVRVGDLVREIARSFAEQDLIKAGDTMRMMGFQAWALRQQKLHETAVAMHEAAIQFEEALKRVDMEPYDAARLRERCLDVRLPHERDAGFVEMPPA